MGQRKSSKSKPLLTLMKMSVLSCMLESAWIRCPSCLEFVHESYAGVESDDADAVHIYVYCAK